MVETVAGLAEPLSEFVQFAGERLQVSCKTKPGVFGDQEIVAVPGDAGAIVRMGAPETWIVCGKTQKPPITGNWPLVMGPPASGWPMVPLSESRPPVLVPPPPATLNQSIE
jgi:hypothetical protein